MKLGNRLFFLSIFFFIILNLSLYSEEKILSSPLINLEKLKPSFEETIDSINEEKKNKIIKNKKKILSKSNISNAKFIGLDKITAKTSEIIINIGEKKVFGSLEIKVLKCGKISSENKDDDVAYLQIKDLTDNENEKVFIFNGWTFSSSPSMAPIDHAIYDLQLVNCNNV
jgi:hypothetical protein